MAWAMVAGAAVSVAGGMISGSKAKKAQAAQDRYKHEQGVAAADMYGNTARSYLEHANRPTTYSNGVGVSHINPVTGEAGYKLAPEYQTLHNGMIGGANKAFGLAGDFNPMTHAKERYDASQALLAPGDQQANDGLMQDLYNKGGFGLTTNQTSVNGQPVGVNPFVNTFMNARNTRNAGMAYKSLGEGESYLDNLINRGNGMMRSGLDLQRFGEGSMQGNMNVRGMFNKEYAPYLDMFNKGTATRFGIEQNPGFADNNASQQWAAGADRLGGMIGNQGNWDKMFGSGYSPNTTALPSSYYGGSSSSWAPGVGF